MYPHYHLHHPPRAIPAVDVSRRRPPTPSSSATAAIVTITGLVVAWCRLPPPSSSPLSSTAAASNPTNDGVPTASPHPPPPPAIPPPPSLLRSLRPLNHQSPMAPSWTGMQRRRPPSWSNAASAAPARTPRRDTGPLHQRRRRDCRNASVSSPAVGGRPSFASRAAAAGRATVTAARQR